jgi:DNA-directed RNA polymerase specialized sigma24 family protein
VRLKVAYERGQAAGEDSQDEPPAAFAALGGPLTWDEFNQLADYRSALVRASTLLAGGDAAAAKTVVPDSFAALQQAWGSLGADVAQMYLSRTVVQQSRSVHRRKHAEDPDAREPAPDVPAVDDEAVMGPGRAASPGALGLLPDRQLEAIVLHNCLGLSEHEVATVMSISRGEARAHLVRGLTSLPRLSQPK